MLWGAVVGGVGRRLCRGRRVGHFGDRSAVRARTHSPTAVSGPLGVQNPKLSPRSMASRHVAVIGVTFFHLQTLTRSASRRSHAEIALVPSSGCCGHESQQHTRWPGDGDVAGKALRAYSAAETRAQSASWGSSLGRGAPGSASPAYRLQSEGRCTHGCARDAGALTVRPRGFGHMQGSLSPLACFIIRLDHRGCR